MIPVTVINTSTIIHISFKVNAYLTLNQFLLFVLPTSFEYNYCLFPYIFSSVKCHPFNWELALLKTDSVVSSVLVVNTCSTLRICTPLLALLTRYADSSAPGDVCFNLRYNLGQGSPMNKWLVATVNRYVMKSHYYRQYNGAQSFVTLYQNDIHTDNCSIQYACWHNLFHVATSTESYVSRIIHKLIEKILFQS